MAALETKTAAQWWESYGDEHLELQNFAIRVLSLTCSSSGCERNWSAFEMVHTKRRNRLKQKMMNDVVFVMTNSKLSKKKKTRKVVDCEIDFDEIDSDNEWIVQDEGTENEILDFTIESEDLEGGTQNEEHEVAATVELEEDECEINNLDDEFEGDEDVKYTPQYKWLCEELTRVDREKTPWLIVLMHVSLYSTNEAHYMVGERMRVVFGSWFIKYKVDVIFVGHVHAYEIPV
ncbi:hypothetical protein TSUD_189580 [Trifolium subterraneum]|uniref:acid phosphatase n=1 Tax=Trifolium subterraneum TaxID=3900 RepID=A0A2Z6LQP7_TRISU|nr:hypothetical protein TSUD_189580 [Trifolium subterraneum]